MPSVGATDHQSVLWCKQLARTIARAIRCIADAAATRTQPLRSAPDIFDRVQASTRLGQNESRMGGPTELYYRATAAQASLLHRRHRFRMQFPMRPRTLARKLRSGKWGGQRAQLLVGMARSVARQAWRGRHTALLSRVEWAYVVAPVLVLACE